MKPDHDAMRDLVHRFREKADAYEKEAISMMDSIDQLEELIADHRLAADMMEGVMCEVENARKPTVRLVESMPEMNINPPVDMSSFNKVAADVVDGIVSKMKAERKVPRYLNDDAEWITKGEDRYLADEGL